MLSINNMYNIMQNVSLIILPISIYRRTRWCSCMRQWWRVTLPWWLVRLVEANLSLLKLWQKLKPSNWKHMELNFLNFFSVIWDFWYNLKLHFVLLRLGVHTKLYTINPKDRSVIELYGVLDPTTRDWTDGLLSNIFRYWKWHCKNPLILNSFFKCLKCKQTSPR